MKIWALLLSLLSGTGASRPDPSILASGQKEAFARITQDEFCSCNSSLTLSGCLEKRPDCRTANHLSHLIISYLQTNASREETLNFVSGKVMGPFCGAAKTFTLNNAPEKGPVNAPIVLVEFADFRCGHCKNAEKYVREAIKRYGTKVRYIFIPFPLQSGSLSEAAAEASLAAHAQGKFWPMHDALFDYKDGELDLPILRKIAQKIGLNLQRYDKDMESHSFREQITSLKNQGVNAGVEGTPAFFVNGRPFEMNPELFSFGQRFEMELDRNAKGCE